MSMSADVSDKTYQVDVLVMHQERVYVASAEN